MKNIRFTAVLAALLMMTGCSENEKADITPVQGTVGMPPVRNKSEESVTSTDAVSEDASETYSKADAENENTKNFGKRQKGNGSFKNSRLSREGMELPEDYEMPKGELGNGEMPGNMKVGRSGPASIEKSGETASYIIPVGMKISGANGRNNDYSSISAGMVLRLTLNADGYVVAAEIL